MFGARRRTAFPRPRDEELLGQLEASVQEPKHGKWASLLPRRPARLSLSQNAATVTLLRKGESSPRDRKDEAREWLLPADPGAPLNVRD